MIRRLITHPALHAWQFMAVYVLYTAVVFQWPTFAYAAQQLDLGTLAGWRTMATLAVLLTLLMVLLLGLPLLLSRRLVKLLAMLLLLGNSVASYYMHSYQVVFDADMMGNVFRSRPDEAWALFHPGLLVWVGLLAGLPAWWIWRLKWTSEHYVARVMHWLMGLALTALWLYLHASTWLWLDRHMSRIGAMTLPWSYVVNGARFKYQAHAANRPVARLPDLTPVVTTGPKANKRVVVLVIGESARAANFSLYGYARPTNPRLSRLPVQVLQARACASYTTASIACMLSPRGAKVDAFPPEETLPTYLYRQGVDVEWRSNNFGEPPMQVTRRLQKTDLLVKCMGPTGGLSELDRLLCAQDRSGAFDGALLLGLEERIASSERDRVLVVLHQAGSHGPVYVEKYPRGAEVFTPVCQSVNLSACAPGTLVNAYDNSIVYTDALLAEVIVRLQRLRGWDSTLVYASDHGESLGEAGLFLHGTPAAWAPDVQMEIPFLIWRSGPKPGSTDATTGAKPGRNDALPHRRSGPYGHDHVFHTVVGALGFKGGAYQSERDVLSHEHH